MDYRLTAELACHKLFRQIIVRCSFQIITIKVLIAYKQLILLQEYKCIAGWEGSYYHRALFVGELGRASPCQVPQPLVSRAQREWEEHLERKRARRLREECRPCTDYLLTSRTKEPRNPDIRRGVVTYRNYEFLKGPSDPCLIKPTGKCFQFTQHSPVLRDKNNYSRSRRRRRSAQCCDDSDTSKHGQSSKRSGRMRGGLDFREEVLGSRRHRYTAHTFPTSLPCKLNTKKRVQSIKPSNSPMHLFSFD